MNNPEFSRRTLLLTGASLLGASTFGTALLGSTGAANAQRAEKASERVWNSFKSDVFGDRPIAESNGIVTLEAPTRAQDAAIVPIDIHIDQTKIKEPIKSVTLIIDVNPSPVAARFDLGKDAGVSNISTRIRVDDYSYLRAIAETESGALYMAHTFIKASGGCGAPAVKNMDEAKSAMGQMKLRQFSPEEGQSGQASAQLMIRHPNNSGLQRDPLTNYYIPAHFINSLAISQGDRPILAVEGGISISEDPNFRFDFIARGADPIKAVASDTEGKEFHDEWSFDTAGL